MAAPPLPHVVFQRRPHRHLHGSHRLHLSPSIEPAESVLSSLVSGAGPYLLESTVRIKPGLELTSVAVLLHPRSPNFLLRSHLHNRHRLHQDLRLRIRPVTTQAHSLGIHRLRRNRNNCPGCRCSSCRSGVLEAERPEHIQSHAARWSCFPGFFLRGLSSRTRGDTVQSNA